MRKWGQVGLSASGARHRHCCGFRGDDCFAYPLECQSVKMRTTPKKCARLVAWRTSLATSCKLFPPKSLRVRSTAPCEIQVWRTVDGRSIDAQIQRNQWGCETGSTDNGR